MTWYSLGAEKVDEEILEEIQEMKLEQEVMESGDLKEFFRNVPPTFPVYVRGDGGKVAAVRLVSETGLEGDLKYIELVTHRPGPPY